MCLLHQRFHHWLPQTQGFIGISLDHHLGEITTITSLPLLISYHVGFVIWVGIISVFNVIYGQPMMFTLITRIQHALSRFRVTRIFLDNTVRVKRDIFRSAYVIQPFAQQWSVHTSMCFRLSCCYKCIVYELWWTCRKYWRLTAYRIWKGNISQSLSLSVQFNIPNTSLIGHNRYRFWTCVLSPWTINVKWSFFPGLL